jgi:hypothetical protein
LLPQPTDWQITAKIFLVAPSYLPIQKVKMRIAGRCVGSKAGVSPMCLTVGMSTKITSLVESGWGVAGGNFF